KNPIPSMTTNPSTARPPRSLAGRLLDLFSNVKFGIALLVLLFIYMSIGSAGILYPSHPAFWHAEAWEYRQLRQDRGLEMTEFEWFHWWPFNLMIALLCINMTVTTIRRIPLNAINAGVWMIHTGIIVLSLGSLYYFATKIEGDAPVARRALTIAMVDAEGGVLDSADMLAMPGNGTGLGVGADRYDVRVQSIDPAWELLSGEDAGERAFSVNLMVERADGERFIRQVIAGFPEYTEDLVFSDDPAQPFQRNVKVNGERLFDESLVVGLDFAPTDHLYLRNDLLKSWALYVREVGANEWIERPIEGGFLYNDYVADRDWVWNPSELDRVDPIDVAIPAVEPDDPAPGVDFRATGYLRYAVMRDQAVPGGPGDPLDPTAWIRVSAPGMDRSNDYVLRAFDPDRNSVDGGLMVMRWIEDEEDLGDTMSPPTLEISIPSLGIELEQPVDEIAPGEEEMFTRIGDTGYGYRVVSLQNDLSLGSGVVSVAILELSTPSGIHRRWVFDDPTLTRDVVDGVPVGDAQHGGAVLGDDSIEIRYRPGSRSALLSIVAGPEEGRLRLVNAVGTSTPEVLDLSVGMPIRLGSDLELLVRQYEPRAAFETKPFIVPSSQRARDAKEFFSRLRLSSPDGGSNWLRYHMYPFDGPEWTLRRHVYDPTVVTLADGRRIEVMFGRRRMPLPAEVSLEEFVLTSHIGDFDGDTANIRDYTSMLRFRDRPGTPWTEPTPVSVNAPVEHEGYWYFQAQWDPPDEPRFQGDVASAGLNYTVLGVGNRNGVYIQLLGCVIAVVGMAYAFYVKPILKQRRRRAVYEQVKGAADSSASETVKEGATA
ncbi:MAG: hypothetical protein VX012_03315, partial [Planctomycetota bacterium]|nr:hypothetical protein [Planctomycetota bacterium]